MAASTITVEAKLVLTTGLRFTPRFTPELLATSPRVEARTPDLFAFRLGTEYVFQAVAPDGDVCIETYHSCQKDALAAVVRTMDSRLHYDITYTADVDIEV